MTREQLRRTVQRRLERSGLSMRDYARRRGLGTAAHLCQFLKHGIEPTPFLLHALGYRRIETESYRVNR